MSEVSDTKIGILGEISRNVVDLTDTQVSWASVRVSMAIRRALNSG
jgi:hypothetical protein